MKVMRDDEGNFMENGHLLGFCRRICRLLFNKIRPVFVFDGATPVLKRLTVAARRQRRETQGAQVRKTAEKLLLKKLKARLLEEEQAQRAVKRGPKPIGKLQYTAERGEAERIKPLSTAEVIALASRAPLRSGEGASTSGAAASATAGSTAGDELLALQLEGGVEGDEPRVLGEELVEERLCSGAAAGQTIDEIMAALEDDVDVLPASQPGALPRSFGALHSRAPST